MWEQFISIVDGFKLTVMLSLIGTDFLLGVIIALKTGEFQFSKLANFLNTSVLGFVGGYYILGFVAIGHPELAPAVLAAYAALDASLLAMVIEKLGKLGVPNVPKVI